MLPTIYVGNDAGEDSVRTTLGDRGLANKVLFVPSSGKLFSKTPGSVLKLAGLTAR